MTDLITDIFIDVLLLVFTYWSIKKTSERGKEGVFYKRLVLIEYILVFRILYLIYKFLSLKCN